MVPRSRFLKSPAASIEAHPAPTPGARPKPSTLPLGSVRRAVAWRANRHLRRLPNRVPTRLIAPAHAVVPATTALWWRENAPARRDMVADAPRYVPRRHHAALASASTPTRSSVPGNHVTAHCTVRCRVRSAMWAAGAVLVVPRHLRCRAARSAVSVRSGRRLVSISHSPRSSPSVLRAVRPFSPRNAMRQATAALRSLRARQIRTAVTAIRAPSTAAPPTAVPTTASASDREAAVGLEAES